MFRWMKALAAPAGDLFALAVPFPDGPLRLREQRPRRRAAPTRRSVRSIAQLMTSSPCDDASVLVGVPDWGAVCPTPARRNRALSIMPHHESAVAPGHAGPSRPRQKLKDKLTLVRRLDSIHAGPQERPGHRSIGLAHKPAQPTFRCGYLPNEVDNTCVPHNLRCLSRKVRMAGIEAVCDLCHRSGLSRGRMSGRPFEADRCLRETAHR
jgi:hypothetical protein